MTVYWCEYAALPDGQVGKAVAIGVDGSTISSVQLGADRLDDAIALAGLTVPGLANCHSHAFHRALRGRTQRDRGSFWTWREQMYGLAARLDPDSYFTLAKAVYREMLAAGYTSVGEFHYLHHGPDGSPYDEPNAMGLALIEAAREVGIRIALLDTCYLTGGIGVPVTGPQVRFTDGTAEQWRDRADRLAEASVTRGSDVVVGAAVHSIRAVPAADVPVVAGWADDGERPLHIHLSEQVAENEACQTAYGASPTQVLADGGALGPRTSVVHATHLSEPDATRLGGAGAVACFCPTTERDLGDGIGPAAALVTAGVGLTLGSDSHAVVDPFEEMRALELDERLATRRRGHWTAAELLTIAAPAGHTSLGFDGVGRIAVGADADLVTVDLTSSRTAGGGPHLETVVFAAGAADVRHVLAAGRVVAARDDHAEIGAELDSAIAAAWGRS